MKNYKKQEVIIKGCKGNEFKVHVGYYAEEIVEMIEDGSYLRYHDMVHKSVFNPLKHVNYGSGRLGSQLKHWTPEQISEKFPDAYKNGKFYFIPESEFEAHHLLFIPLWGYVTLCDQDGNPTKTFLSNKQRADEVVQIFCNINYEE